MPSSREEPSSREDSRSVRSGLSVPPAPQRLAGTPAGDTGGGDRWGGGDDFVGRVGVEGVWGC